MIEPTWQNADAQLWNANGVDVIKSLPDKSVDVIIMDFPYGIGIDYGDYQDTPENLHKLAHAIIPECRRVGRITVVFVGQTGLWKCPESDWIFAWIRPATPDRCAYGFNSWTPILVYGKDNTVPDGCLPTSFTLNTTLRNHEDTNNHPCPKPREPVEWLIKRLSKRGETIADFVMGSGTTGLCALSLGRKFIGAEISAKYFEICKHRISSAREQEVLFK